MAPTSRSSEETSGPGDGERPRVCARCNEVGDVGRWDGIARIGHFDGNIGVTKNQTGDFTARIELAR